LDIATYLSLDKLLVQEQGVSTVNVTEDVMRDYIALFHKTLEATAAQFLPAEHRQSLLHVSLLPAEIVGYISTQFGAGIEYKSAERTEIRIVRGNSRVEDLLVQAPRHTRETRPIVQVQGESGSFVNPAVVALLVLEDTFPFRLAGINAGVRIYEVTFRIGAWHREVDYAEIFGNRSLEFWSKEQAISRAKDEVLAALVDLKRAEERHLSRADYIAKFNERTVLVLGAYDEAGMQRLLSIATVLSDRGYDPIQLQDFPDIPGQDFTRKVATIGCLARFVMIDDSTKSGHLAEVPVARMLDWIIVLLRQGGKAASQMTVGASATSNVILEQSYDEVSLHEGVDAAIKWAEAKIVELGRTRDPLFPWRRQG
jgi:hypothetical protein